MGRLLGLPEGCLVSCLVHSPAARFSALSLHLGVPSRAGADSTHALGELIAIVG